MAMASMLLLTQAPPAKAKGKTYSDVFSQALIELAEIEPNMVVITPATAEGSGVVKFGKQYPDRLFDVAICEQHAVTMAAGMAKAGLETGCFNLFHIFATSYGSSNS